MGGYRRQDDNVPEPAKPNLAVIMGNDEVASAQEIVRAASAWGEYLANQGLTTSQIRTIFGQVREIEMGWAPGDESSALARQAQRALVLLKPKLAYQARRDEEKNRKKPVDKLAGVLIPAIDQVGESRDRFQRFVDLFEAILAYHRAKGGK